MTVLREQILADLADHPESTTQEIADRIGKNPQGIVGTLSELRSGGFVNDGSTGYRWPSGKASCSHRPEGLTKWSVGGMPWLDQDCPTRVRGNG